MTNAEGGMGGEAWIRTTDSNLSVALVALGILEMRTEAG